MKEEKSGGSAVGVSFITMLTTIFVVLKLTGLINWPWIWVLSPMWVPAALIFIGCIILIFIALLLGRI